VTYRLSSTSALHVKLNKATSFVCEQADPRFHDLNILQIVTGGTGKFSKVNKALSTISVVGLSYPTATAGSYLDQGQENASLAFS
jgi:hypothetical protein